MAATNGKTSVIKTLFIVVLSDNTKSAKFSGLTSLINSEKTITDLAKKHSLTVSVSNGNITVFCQDEGSISKFVKVLVLNNII
ncbi:MAG: hypothetical protein ACLUHC_00730 [Clostridia bacterium]